MDSSSHAAKRAAPGRAPSGGQRPEEDSRAVSRREMLRRTGLLAAAAALTPELLLERGWGRAAGAAGPDLVTDTFNGLVAFIVPGPDAYSIHQGVSTPEPGGIAANATAPLLFALDLVELAPPPFPGFSALAAFILNNVALAIHPGVSGPFDSPFANLSFPEKVTVFAAMESGAVDPALVPLGGALPVFVAFIAYSEAGVFNPFTRTLAGQPVGWAISGYDGPADGRDEFLGYFQNRRRAD